MKAWNPKRAQMEPGSILSQEHGSNMYNIFLHCNLQKALNLHKDAIQKRQSVILLQYLQLYTAISITSFIDNFF